MTDNRTIDETMTQEVIDIPYGGKKNVILDATILSSFMACPRMTDFRFNHNLISQRGKSNSLECGSIVHTFLENYYKGMIQKLHRGETVTKAFEAAELYIRGCKFCHDFKPTDENPKPECGHRPNEYPGVYNTPQLSTGQKEGNKTGWQTVLDICQQYVDFYVSDHWVPLEVEIVKKEVLYEDDEIRVLWKAKLDLVSDTNQGIYPIDHKTMKQRRDTNSMNNQFMGQCIIQKTQNVIINKIGFQITLKPEEKFLRVPVSYSTERLLEWQSETLPFYSKLLLMYAETGHYPPNFNNCEGKYGNCPFYEHVCSSDPGMREENLRAHFMVGPEWNPTNDGDE